MDKERKGFFSPSISQAQRFREGPLPGHRLNFENPPNTVVAGSNVVHIVAPTKNFTFAGEQHEDVNRWISRLEFYWLQTNEVEPEAVKKKKLMAIELTGIAHDWVCDQREAFATWTYDQFKQAIITKFGEDLSLWPSSTLRTRHSLPLPQTIPISRPSLENKELC